MLSDVGGFHLCLCSGVNLLYWSTSVLLRNKAKHDEDEIQWKFSLLSLASFSFRFGKLCREWPRESRFAIDFCSCCVLFFFSISCYFSRRIFQDGSSSQRRKAWKIVFDQSFKVAPWGPVCQLWSSKSFRSGITSFAIDISSFSGSSLCHNHRSDFHLSPHKWQHDADNKKKIE